MVRTTRADRWLIGLLIAGSLIGFGLIFWLGTNHCDRYVSIQVDGVEKRKIPLDGSTDGKEYKITSKFGTNTVVIEKEGVYIREADCPDKLCVHQGKISNPGIPLVCLPHRLLVTIEDANAEKPDSVVR